MKFKFIKKEILVILLLCLVSCQSVKDAVQGKKRSETSDEFLVDKKDPLSLPPDFDELPVPLGEDQVLDNQETEIKDILQLEKLEQTNQVGESASSGSIENSIIEKIND